jgi:hypothetical protein
MDPFFARGESQGEIKKGPGRLGSLMLVTSIARQDLDGKEISGYEAIVALNRHSTSDLA